MDNIDNAEQRSRLPDRAHRTPSRRTVLGGLTAGSLLVLHWRGARAAFAVPDGAPRPIRFDIMRAGDVIGTHEVDFALTGGALSATTRIEVEVRVLAVKLFE